MLLTSLKSYDRAQFAKDVTAGIIVAIIALPLSIALALASGVGPEAGIFTAIVAGFVISALGGSCVQIACGNGILDSGMRTVTFLSLSTLFFYHFI